MGVEKKVGPQARGLEILVATNREGASLWLKSVFAPNAPRPPPFGT